MGHPITANSVITRPTLIPMNSTVQIKPKMLSLKLIKPHGSCTSVVDHTTLNKLDLQYLTTTIPFDSMINKSDTSRIQPQAITDESSSATNSMQHMPIVPSLDSIIKDSDDEKENTNNKNGYFIWDHKTIMLFFAEYEQHEKKLQKKKYQSKEAMFQALAELFQKKSYVNATKNHMKNKFKLLKKKWDKYVKRTVTSKPRRFFCVD